MVCCSVKTALKGGVYYTMKRSSFVLIFIICYIIVLLCGCENSDKGGSSVAESQLNAASQTEPSSDTAPASTGNNSAAHAETTAGGEDQTTGEPDATAAASFDNTGSFIDENGFKVYVKNGQPASVNGIDVSSYCGDIDWNRVKAAGVSFVMVRLGGRGYGADGSLYSDDRAAEYISGAQAAGIKAGGYFFSQAVNADEARDEAMYCRQILGNLKLDYPLAYDLEFIKNDDARTDGMTVEQATTCARSFCDAAKELGYEPMLYFSDTSEPSAKYDLTRLSDCEIWFSEYTDSPSFPGRFGMWQYSNTAAIDGIQNNADLNLRIVG